MTSLVDNNHSDTRALRYPGPYPVFFIGASAGGVNALQQIASQLPEEFPAPVFMLLHRKRVAEPAKELLPDLLRYKSRMKVTIPEAGEVVKAGHIYLPKTDFHLAVEDNRIVHLKEPNDSHWRPSIDVLFKSGARDYTDRTVSILLTGGLHDGVEGLRETTFQGGVTVAQSPEDAYDPRLPLNALLNDHPAYVLALDNIARLMCEMCGYNHFDGQQQVCQEAAANAVRIKNSLIRKQKS